MTERATAKACLPATDAAIVLDMLEMLGQSFLVFGLNEDGDEVLEAASADARTCLELHDEMLRPGRLRSELARFLLDRGDLPVDFVYDQHLAAIRTREMISHTIRTRSGRRVRIVSRRRGSGGSIVLCTDVSAEIADRLRSQETEQRCAAVLDSTPTGILRVERTGRTSLANRACLHLFGFEATPEQSEALSALDLNRALVPCDGGRLQDHIEAGAQFEASIPLLPPRRSRRIMVTVSPPVTVEGAPARVLSLVDITALCDARARIEYLARHDPLTGLGNRIKLNEAWNRLEPTVLAGHPVHLTAIDLDLFKDVNDEHGHGVGDLLLGAVAQRLEAGLAPSETAFRTGGDEFILLSEGGDARDMPSRVAKLAAALSEPFLIDGRTLRISASAGTASAPRDGTGRDELHRIADASLYAAKRAARQIDPAAPRGYGAGRRAAKSRPPASSATLAKANERR